MQAAENYVELHTGTGRHLLRVPLGTLEESLDPGTFLRIHRSLVVNVHQIKELQPAFHGEDVRHPALGNTPAVEPHESRPNQQVGV